MSWYACIAMIACAATPLSMGYVEAGEATPFKYEHKGSLARTQVKVADGTQRGRVYITGSLEDNSSIAVGDKCKRLTIVIGEKGGTTQDLDGDISIGDDCEVDIHVNDVMEDVSTLTVGNNCRVKLTIRAEFKGAIKIGNGSSVDVECEKDAGGGGKITCGKDSEVTLNGKTISR